MPSLDGAERRTMGLYNALANVGAKQTLVASNFVLAGGGSEENYPWKSSRDRSKYRYAIGALLGRKNYWYHKFCTIDYRDLVRKYSFREWDAVILNFIFCKDLLTLLPSKNRKLTLIDTHNYDPACFEMLGKHGNPLSKYLARTAMSDSYRQVGSLPSDICLLTVSKRDQASYHSLREDLEGWVVPNGCEFRPILRNPLAGERCLLIFVGSLSSKMNVDCLENFSTKFWPSLRDIADFHVIGSTPNKKVRDLCRSDGWALHSNVTDAQLDEYYAVANFSILPFGYGEGSKLKVFESCSKGLPVLATSSGICGIEYPPSGIIVADDPGTWREIVCAALGGRAIPAEPLIAFAKEYSWSRIAEDLMRKIENRLKSIQKPVNSSIS